MKKPTKIISAGLLAAIICLTSFGTASAHVKILPTEVVPGYQDYQIRVPNEMNQATTKLVLDVPANLNVTNIMPLPGWTYAVMSQPIANSSAADDDAPTAHISQITWQGNLAVGQFIDFTVAAEYTGAPTTLNWKAYQTYQDGTVVKWDGSDQDHPAPSVKVVDQTELDAVITSDGQLKTDLANKQDKSTFTNLGTWLGGAGFLMGFAALLIVLRSARKN